MGQYKVLLGKVRQDKASFDKRSINEALNPL
jgi:hypothetical protein